MILNISLFALAFTLGLILNAPLGYEDERGFHLGDE